MSRGLYLDDKQIAAELGIPVEEWKAIADTLDRDGLPPPNPMFRDRRYWPAVKAFLDDLEGVNEPPEARHRRKWEKEENFNVKPRQRARSEKTHAG